MRSQKTSAVPNAGFVLNISRLKYLNLSSIMCRKHIGAMWTLFKLLTYNDVQSCINDIYLYNL